MEKEHWLQPLNTLARITFKYRKFHNISTLRVSLKVFLESFNYCLRYSVLQSALDSISLCLILQCKHVQEVAEWTKG